MTKEVKNAYEKAIFQEWKSQLQAKYPDYQQNATDFVAGMIIPMKGTTVRVVSSIDSNQLYCQVDMDHLDKEKRDMPQEVAESVKHLLPKENDGPQFWKWLPRYAYDETYQLLCEVIGAIVGI